MFVTVDYKEGDKVVCSTDRLKNFSKGNIYTIEKITYNKKYAFMNMPHLGGRDGFVDKLKLKGINGSVSHSNFESIGPDEQRDITISQVFDEETKVTDTPTKNRKIDEVESKTYQMFELLMNRIARDRNRLAWIKDYNDFDTMISIIAKGDRIWGIEESDFDCIKNMTISDLMTLFIKYRQEKGC
jgi:hypothetical protein